MQPKNITLLLTACVNPEGMRFTALQDPQVRYKQYIDAVRFYLEKTSLKIVFIDNSGCDISFEFEEYIRKERLEVLYFNGNSFDKKLGKGYGEMLIIEYALKYSCFISKSQYILKITGRLKLLNIDKVLQQISLQRDLDILLNLINMLSYADSRCFAASYSFFQTLVSSKEQVNDSINVTFEHVLLATVHRRIEEGYKGYKFYLNKNFFRFSGMSGTSGNTFSSNLLRYFWKNLRSNLRYYLLK
jgi:hypothetical protein